MRLKIFILAIILATITLPVFAKVSDEATNEVFSEEIDAKIKQEIKDAKEQNEKQIKDIINFLPKTDKIIINNIEKNGRKIIEINSNILDQENNQPIFYVKEAVKDPLILYPSESNAFEFKNNFYKFTDSPFFRFKNKNSPNGKVDFTFDGSKIKFRTEDNYVLSENNFKVQDAALYLEDKNQEYPVNYFPGAIFKKAINAYKNYEIKSANLVIENGQPEYKVNLKINGKILRLFDTSFDLKATMNIENGKITVEKPWWETFVF